MDRAHREILVIEDEPAIGLALLVAGRKQGWNVHLVETGNEGLALLAEQSIQLVLLDLGLPDMRGLEVLGRIQASRPTLPVLIMTGSRSEHDEALRFGATGFLYKPFGINNFNAAVRRVFELKPVEPPAPAP